MSIFIILIIILPLLFAANATVNEAVKIYHGIRSTSISEISAKFSTFFGENINLELYIKEILSKISIAIMEGTSNFILSLPQKLISFFVVIFVLYYLFKEGENIIRRIKKLPIKEKYFRKLNNVIYAIIFGLIVTGIIQGVVGALGLWIFKGPSPIILGAIMMILSILPVIGPWLVWFPLAVFKLVSGDFFNGFGLLLYGFLFITLIDTVVRPKIIGARAKIHPVLILLGVLGGIYTLGLVGVIIGPVVLVTLTLLIEMYINEKTKKNETKS